MFTSCLIKRFIYVQFDDFATGCEYGDRANVVSSVVVVCIVVVSGCKAQVLQQVTSRLVAV
jgi:hypothetical protein